jgi:isopentenyldiphosphate isomerase
MDEQFEIYDAAGNRCGLAPRSACHGNPTLLHRTAHVVIFDRQGNLLLQKRSPHKDIQPGKWDTAVGGHLAPGDDYRTAAEREMREELGVAPVAPLRFLFTSKIRNAVESEDVGVFATEHDGPFLPDPGEVSGLRFWSPAEVLAGRGTGQFTPNLEHELDLLSEHGIWGGKPA